MGDNMEVAAQMQLVEEVDNSVEKPLSEKQLLKKQLNELFTDSGAELFIQGSNAENQAIMDAASANMDGSSVVPDGNANATVAYDQILEFMTAVMTKQYAEGFRVAELILAHQPGNKLVSDMLPFLEKLKDMPHEEGSSSENSDSDGSSSEGTDDSDSGIVYYSESDDEENKNDSLRDYLSDSSSSSSSDSNKSSSSDSEAPDTDSNLNEGVMTHTLEDIVQKMKDTDI